MQMAGYLFSSLLQYILNKFCLQFGYPDSYKATLKESICIIQGALFNVLITYKDFANLNIVAH